MVRGVEALLGPALDAGPGLFFVREADGTIAPRLLLARAEHPFWLEAIRELGRRAGARVAGGLLAAGADYTTGAAFLTELVGGSRHLYAVIPPALLDPHPASDATPWLLASRAPRSAWLAAVLFVAVVLLLALAWNVGWPSGGPEPSATRPQPDPRRPADVLGPSRGRPRRPTPGQYWRCSPTTCTECKLGEVGSGRDTCFAANGGLARPQLV